MPYEYEKNGQATYDHNLSAGLSENEDGTITIHFNANGDAGRFADFDLPIIPEAFVRVPRTDNARTEALLKNLVKQMKRDEVQVVVNACDAGREGELIFNLVADHAEKTGLELQRDGQLRDARAALSIAVLYEPDRLDALVAQMEKDCDEARRLLEQAGYSEENPLRVEIRYNSSGNHKKVALAMWEIGAVGRAWKYVIEYVVKAKAAWWWSSSTSSTTSPSSNGGGGGSVSGQEIHE
mgnify:CR=1 FL=1